MLPYLKIGGSRKDFWELTPHDILLDFKAYNEREKDESRKMVENAWAIGKYVQAALASTPVVMGFIKNKSEMPKYPDLPDFNEQSDEEKITDEKWVETERLKAWAFFSNIGKMRR